MAQSYVIIGASAAGIACAMKLRQLDPVGNITIISEELSLPYNKCLIGDYIAQKRFENQLAILSSHTAGLYNFLLLLGTQVVQLNRACKEIVCSDGIKIGYDTLLLATGARPNIPHIDGLQDVQKGIFTYHTLQDATSIMQYVQTNKIKQVTILGAGLSGLECADALRGYRCEITLIEKSHQILANRIDQQGAHYIVQQAVRYGVSILVNEQVLEVLHKQGTLCGLRLASAKHIETHMLIIATGVRSNIELALQAGLEINQGIMVNSAMRTADESIFAAGDCIMLQDYISGQVASSSKWSHAVQQGILAAHAMVGDIKKSFTGAPIIHKTNIFDIPIVFAGNWSSASNKYEIKQMPINTGYHSVLLDDTYVRGYIVVGDMSLINQLRNYAAHGPIARSLYNL